MATGAVVGMAKRYGAEVAGAHGGAGTGATVMNFSWGVAITEIAADNAAQGSHAIEVLLFGFGFVGAFSAHAGPPAKTETPRTEERCELGTTIIGAIVRSQLAQQLLSQGCSIPCLNYSCAGTACPGQNARLIISSN